MWQVRAEEKFIVMWVGKSEDMGPHGKGLDMAERVV